MTPRQRRARGNALRQLRESAGLSREELATKMGLKDVSAVRHWERGTARPRDLVRFARICKTDVDAVLAVRRHQPPEAA